MKGKMKEKKIKSNTETPGFDVKNPPIRKEKP
jgi:hypothetical protein